MQVWGPFPLHPCPETPYGITWTWDPPQGPRHVSAEQRKLTLGQGYRHPRTAASVNSDRFIAHSFMGTKTLPRLVMGHAIAVSSEDNSGNTSPLHSGLQSRHHFGGTGKGLTAAPRGTKKDTQPLASSPLNMGCVYSVGLEQYCEAEKADSLLVICKKVEDLTDIINKLEYVI
ncbi:hypothetical protein E5288_WYG014662 [Bos mutus]|uniref:Uncharacterized protein n=1 Tax=Bos mutus TaxID=72004 RepID=A0A6B0R6S8_9CETA|nr:hypothetical protein [Bos mutus]